VLFRSVSFLSAIKAADTVAAVVDISPRKHGQHVAGTGHKVIPPEALRDLKPDMVIIMNPIYKDEIGETVRQLGLTAEVVCV
jgi:ABC-type hemin transport system substrate-binding protein